MASKIDQNTLIGAGAGALLGALAMTMMKKKATPTRLALGAAVGAAAIGGVAYASSQTKVAGMDQTGMLLPVVGEVDLVKAGSGAFAGAAIGTAFGQPVIGTAVGAAAGTALAKWAAA